MSRLTAPLHPGEVLKELYLLPSEMSEGQLARALNVPRTRIERLTKGTSSVSVDTAKRLAKFFGTSAEYWLNMQVNYDVAHQHVDVDHIAPLNMPA